MTGVTSEAAQKIAEKHNSAVAGVGPNSNAALKAFVERIERVTEEKDSLAQDVRDIYGEAKNHSYDCKAVRAVVALRKQDVDKRHEHEALVDLYMHALGMS